MGMQTSKPSYDADLHTAVEQNNVNRVTTRRDSLVSQRSTPVNSVQNLQRLGVTSDNDATYMYDVNGVDEDGHTALMKAVSFPISRPSNDVIIAAKSHSIVLNLL